MELSLTLGSGRTICHGGVGAFPMAQSPQPQTARQLAPQSLPGRIPTFRRFGLPRQSDQATARTIAFMRAMADGSEGARNPVVRHTALRVVANVPSRDQYGEINALYHFVKGLKFRGEYGETLQTPAATLHYQAGDCDDHATLLAALLKSLGFTVRFVTVASDATAPREWTHVFVEVQDKRTRQWIPLDTTEKSAYPGWRPPRVYRTGQWKPLGSNQVYPAPLSPTAATIYNLVDQLGQPLVNAEAQRIAYPQGTALFANSSALGVNMTTWVWGGLLVFGAVLAIGAARKHR